MRRRGRRGPVGADTIAIYRAVMDMLKYRRMQFEHLPNNHFVKSMKRLFPLFLSSRFAVFGAGTIVSPALAHGSSAGGSSGFIGPLVLIAGVGLFAGFLFFVRRR